MGAGEEVLEEAIQMSLAPSRRKSGQWGGCFLTVGWAEKQTGPGLVLRLSPIYVSQGGGRTMPCEGPHSGGRSARCRRGSPMAATSDLHESKIPAMECRWKKELWLLSIPPIPCLSGASPAQSRQREMIREVEDGIEDGFLFCVAQRPGHDDFTAGGRRSQGSRPGAISHQLRCQYFQVLI